MDQHIEQFAQLSAAGTWGGLAEAAEQGAQFDELLQPFAQQLPAAIEAVLLGQSLAIAEQLPAKRDDGIVQRHARCQFRCGQLQAVAIGVIQAVAAFGLADVAGHQRQVGGQFGGQFQQRFGLALAQFQLQLADLLGLLAGLDLAQVSAASMTTLVFPRPQAISAFSRTKSVVKIGFRVFLSRSARLAGQQSSPSFLMSSLALSRYQSHSLRSDRPATLWPRLFRVWMNCSPSRRRLTPRRHEPDRARRCRNTG